MCPCSLHRGCSRQPISVLSNSIPALFTTSIANFPEEMGYIYHVWTYHSSFPTCTGGNKPISSWSYGRKIRCKTKSYSVYVLNSQHARIRARLWPILHCIWLSLGAVIPAQYGFITPSDTTPSRQLPPCACSEQIRVNEASQLSTSRSGGTEGIQLFGHKPSS